jgi:ABC-type dipeptide/oligopeptide/nickel transport system permease component
MLRYIVQRLALSVPVFLSVVTIVFLIVRVLPGDPAQAALGDYASKEAVDALRTCALWAIFCARIWACR